MAAAGHLNERPPGGARPSALAHRTASTAIQARDGRRGPAERTTAMRDEAVRAYVEDRPPDSVAAKTKTPRSGGVFEGGDGVCAQVWRPHCTARKSLPVMSPSWC